MSNDKNIDFHQTSSRKEKETWNPSRMNPPALKSRHAKQ